jgi:hypothetical protein
VWDLLAGGLRPFVKRELQGALGERWESPARNSQRSAAVKVNWDDPQVLLAVVLDQWQPVFGNALGRNDRNLVHELETVRNARAHREQFTSNDAIRALDSVKRLLTAVSAAEAGQIRMDLMRTLFDEQRRSEMRKKSFTPTEGKPQGASSRGARS